ncbi:hypothetical protein ACIGBH_38540 [Streptomyces sp. NPDC085929]|uniref:hypothetical protein n=1 Tax=Streptomyces sp. NPDC085929 TaxID=3365739 RepID=UPI0037D3E72A
MGDAPRWQVWQLLATSYVEDGVRGIMFDAGGAFQRQGFAAFHDAIKGEDPASRRAQLRTHVHELGHAFNLLHSWQKNLADPPQPLGPNGGFGDRSWMNYVQNYQPPPPAPGGQAAYWADFPFQFTDSELVHLRHGFYRDVITGSNPFGVGAAEIDVDLFDNPVIDNSGLTLELRSNGSFLFGEPVVIEVKLATTDLRGCVTHGRLHPKDGFVTVAIRTPSGEAKVYRPALIRCVDQELQTVLDADRSAIYESAYIGYGKDGFYFQQPGRYQLRAQYYAADGSRVLSPSASSCAQRRAHTPSASRFPSRWNCTTSAIPACGSSVYSTVPRRGYVSLTTALRSCSADTSSPSHGWRTPSSAPCWSHTSACFPRARASTLRTPAGLPPCP